eukprot:snap_masked-scaffold_19-processed-gene-4.3-mRNA-1 protein AED:0.27 eAED:0.27 QI:0/0/0/0.5/1/1/2/0/447
MIRKLRLCFFFILLYSLLTLFSQILYIHKYFKFNNYLPIKSGLNKDLPVHVNWNDIPTRNFTQHKNTNHKIKGNKKCDHVNSYGNSNSFWMDLTNLIRGRNSTKIGLITCPELLNFGVSHPDKFYSSWAEKLWFCLQCNKNSNSSSREGILRDLKDDFIRAQNLEEFLPEKIKELAYKIKPQEKVQENLVAICFGATSRHLNLTFLKPLVNKKLSESEMEKIILTIKYKLFDEVFPAYKKYEETKFIYSYYIGADYGDLLFEYFQPLVLFAFNKYLNSTLQIILINNKIKKPGPAFNLATYSAYLDGNQYIYRTNDDTKPITFWTSEFISVLQNNLPKNFGVVGPKSLEGNNNILTHDFVHRTHFEIFDIYYPIVLYSWFLDDWISYVYGNHHTCRLRNVFVDHLVEYKEKRFFQSLNIFSHKILVNHVKSRYDLGDEKVGNETEKE